MPIDKYLCSLKLPEFQPGPFTVRLKYELKRIYFDQKLSKSFHYAYSSTIFSLFVICLLFIFRPQVAQKINNFVLGGNDNTLDMLLLAERDIDISNFPSTIRTVSADITSSLPFIEEDKSYLIHKFRNHDNKTFIYFSEIKGPQEHRILY